MASKNNCEPSSPLQSCWLEATQSRPLVSVRGISQNPKFIMKFNKLNSCLTLRFNKEIKFGWLGRSRWGNNSKASIFSSQSDSTSSRLSSWNSRAIPDSLSDSFVETDLKILFYIIKVVNTRLKVDFCLFAGQGWRLQEEGSRRWKLLQRPNRF